MLVVLWVLLELGDLLRNVGVAQEKGEEIPLSTYTKMVKKMVVATIFHVMATWCALCALMSV